MRSRKGPVDRKMGSRDVLARTKIDSGCRLERRDARWGWTSWASARVGRGLLKRRGAGNTGMLIMGSYNHPHAYGCTAQQPPIYTQSSVTPHDRKCPPVGADKAGPAGSTSGAHAPPPPPPSRSSRPSLCVVRGGPRWSQLPPPPRVRVSLRLGRARARAR